MSSRKRKTDGIITPSPPAAKRPSRLLRSSVGKSGLRGEHEATAGHDASADPEPGSCAPDPTLRASAAPYWTQSFLQLHRHQLSPSLLPEPDIPKASRCNTNHDQLQPLQVEGGSSSSGRADPRPVGPPPLRAEQQAQSPAGGGRDEVRGGRKMQFIQDISQWLRARTGWQETFTRANRPRMSDNNSPAGGRKVSFGSDAVSLISPRSIFGLDKFSPRRRSQEGRIENLDNDANKENSKQALLATKRGTIWNAVAYAHTQQGRQSWETATRSDDPWMRGGTRGVMGETPLHLAVLLNNSPDHDRVMNQLWDQYPALRTAVYEKPLYHGENVLHIAIVRKLSRSIIEKFVESSEGQELMLQRADGDFFKIPDLSDGCCNYGELPLGFAACTNQKDVFDYLVEKGAQLNFTTQEGRNLLHLMVLQSTGQGEMNNKISKTEKIAFDWSLHMYDHIEQHMRQKGLYDLASAQLDEGKKTPLTLAASEGSLQMFNHLFGKLMKIEWVFGPVTCRKLYLRGIDVPLSKEKADGDRKAKCVLDVVVESERLDILTEGQMKKILDSKWDKYAKRKYQARFWWAILYASLQLFLTSTNPQFFQKVPAGNLYIILVLCEVWCGFFHMKPCIREIKELFMHGFKDFFGHHQAHVVDRVFALTNCPLMLTLIMIRWIRYQPKMHAYELEKCLAMILSGLAFFRVFRQMMGFPEYGHFVLMLMQMLRHDMRKFFAIYLVFLFGFSHLLYISSEQENAGYSSFLISMRIGFDAVLQDVDLDLEKSGRNRLSVWNVHLVFIIVVCNFFMVNLVLINLLIAMMSSTYDDITNAAKRQWNLVRARIITNIDKEMTDTERISTENIYWQWEGSRRFMTFTTSENLHPYLTDTSK